MALKQEELHADRGDAAVYAAGVRDPQDEDEDVDMEDGDNAAAAVLQPRPLSWDERRKLALDIVNLAPPDQPGVLLLVHNFIEQHGDAGDKKESVLTQREMPLPMLTQWDATAAHEADDELVGSASADGSNRDRIQLECGVDLDQASPELLNQLRNYVDSCYIPHFVPKENCSICEGLWSSGRVIACGNDACDTRIHEECFGVVLRESDDGPWRCPSCLLGRQLMCAVCMQYGGALKPVAANHITANSSSAIDDQKWVHTLCAMAIPELVMRDVPAMEPVDGFEEIENGRFRYLCGICRKRGGASIICEQENCNVGMHPLCAGNAGLMVGTETNPLAVYCEKHLPASRIIGAKRLISDEDLVEEIMSENNSVDEDIDDKFPAANETQRYSFIFACTPFLYHKSKLLGDKATLKWGGSGGSSTKKTDLRAKTFANVKMNASASWGMASDAGGWKAKRPMVYPPVVSAEPRIGVPPFPAPAVLIDAIVDFLVKEQDEWVRARVLEWDTAKQMHLVQVVASNQKLWATLSTSNTLVLYLADEESLLDGPRVRLFRPVKQGEAQWRPKPRTFAGANTAAST